MKDKIKQLLIWRLEASTRKFFKAHPDVRLIVVAGSVGKTSTKLAIAQMLAQKYRIHVHKDNHNMELSVPLSIMKIPYPSNPRSLLQWIAVLVAAHKRPQQPFPFDIIVTELGTDRPGDIAKFGRYLQADVAVVTAVSAEHMENFGNLTAVAEEELSVAKFAKLLVINRDDIDGQFAQMLEDGRNIDTYGVGGTAEYHFLPETGAADGYMQGTLVTPEHGSQHVKLQVIGEHSLKSIVAAALIGIKFGLTADEVRRGVEAIEPVPGRMQLLRGIEGGVIIDDTYNSSPLAALAALQTLYTMPNQHRIAILGSMNELGPYSKQAHEEIGNACDPSLLDIVVTIGEEAEDYLAPAAAARGCQVRCFRSPYDAGAFVRSIIEPKTAILAKGSQNGVFAEEAIKILLHTPGDDARLVRQSADWLKIKQDMFSKIG